MKTYSLEEIYEKIINNQKDKDILRKKILFRKKSFWAKTFIAKFLKSFLFVLE